MFGQLACERAAAGAVVLVPVIAPFADGRAAVRHVHEENNVGFLEVYVATPIAECERRDVKGLYSRQRRGELQGLTGVDDPYEVPLSPDFRVDTVVESIAESIDRLRRALSEAGFVPQAP
jgi:adenylylsulfate kinase